jgi:hypothetical protein
MSTQPDRVTVVLGNDQPVIPARTDAEGNHLPRESVEAKHAGYKRRATVVHLDAQLSQRERAADVARVWAELSDAEQPAWVASDDDALAARLAEDFDGAEVRELDVDDLETPSKSDERRAAKGGKPSAFDIVGGPLFVALTALSLSRLALHLRVNSGIDFQAAQMGGTPGAAAVYIGLTANATAPTAADTTLTAEITTAGGGLIRGAVAATYSHSTGVASYTLVKTFTANGTDALPVTIAKIGVFTAATSGGTMVFETLLTPSTATLSASGDSLQVTESVSL